MKKIYLLTLLFAPLCLLAQTQKLPGSLDWEKKYGGTKIDKARSVIATADHGFLVVGLSFSNDGHVTGHHGTTDSSDAWVIKLNSAGEIEWQQSYGGSNTDEFVHAIQAGNGDFICVGATRSVDGDVTGLHTGNGLASDLWVVRINRYGVIQWSKVFGGTGEDHGRVIRKMPDGNYMVAGNAKSNDFDVTGNQGGSDIWVLTINGQGNLLWQKTYGNPNHQFVSSITVTSDNNFIISGYQVYNNYPTPTQTDLPVYSEFEEAALKIDGQGTVLWQQFPFFTKGNPGPSRSIYRIVELPGHQLMQVYNGYNASLTSFSDWDLRRINSSNGTVVKEYNTSNTISKPRSSAIREIGPDAVQILSDSTILTCINAASAGIRANLNRINTREPAAPGSTIDFLYQIAYDIPGTGELNGVIALHDDEYVAAGTMDNADVWIIKVKSLNQIKGKVFVDNNGNGVKEAGESFFKNGFVESKKNGAVTRSLLDADGSFLNFVDTGTYTSIVTANGKFYYTPNPTSKQSAFTTYKNTDSFSFAVVPLPGINDLQVSLKSLSALRPGFNASYRVDYSNVGTTTSANTVIKLVKPSVASYVSATLPPAAVIADTITWNIGSLSPFDVSSFNLVLKLDPPPALNIDTILKCYAVIEPVTGDVTPRDNSDTLVGKVTGSFDPNDKQENHNGTLYLEQLQAGQPLTYTIRFQNMGTDTAFNIVVKDTLSDQLDVSTLEIIGASHPFQFNLKNNRYGTFTFNDILLPDHNTNEPASHGYIIYRIKPKSSLQLGDKIHNSASVYFDFNLPVQTNTQETVITPTPLPAPPSPIITGMQSNYCNNLGVQKIKIINLPAAVSGTAVTAKIDADILTVGADSTISFTVSALSAATHNLTVTYSNVTDTKTTTAGFTITAAATPEVNLSANTANVTNLANPVIVTASNAGGGGKNPLYTFAWNNSFTNIVRTESSNSILNINATSLSLGDNKVYVKMKTSEDCYMVQTNIDSITIRRDMSTGVTDTDFPGQVINIFPNPVTGPININGLNTGKTYTFTIVNLQGQVIMSKQVVNQRTTEIKGFNGVAGIYFLNIYDEKRNRKLGSVQLIKQ